MLTSTLSFPENRALSIYTTTITILLFFWYIKTSASEVDYLNPNISIDLVSCFYYAKVACLSLYIALCRWSTFCSFPLILNLFGCSIKISLSSLLYKKALLILRPVIYQSSRALRASTSCTVSNLTTGEKISSKSIPSTWENFLVTKYAFFWPFVFWSKTYLHLIVFCIWGKSIIS